MKKGDPRTLALDLLPRSTCNIQVAAVIFDGVGVFAWGWNSAGPDGLGLCAEAHALTRANIGRIRNAASYSESFRPVIVVAGRRRGNVVPSKPCAKCAAKLRRVGIRTAYIQNKAGVWHPVSI